MLYTSSKLNNSSGHDEEESQQFSVGEDILDSGGPLHVPAVDEGQDTDAYRGQHLDTLLRGVALGEDELDAVLGEGEGHDGDGAGSHDQALRPQPHEPDERTQRVKNVGVVTPGLKQTLRLNNGTVNLHLSDE